MASRYDESCVATLADTIRLVPRAALRRAEEVSSVFDNTASGIALENFPELHERVAGKIPRG